MQTMSIEPGTAVLQSPSDSAMATDDRFKRHPSLLSGEDDDDDSSIEQAFKPSPILRPHPTIFTQSASNLTPNRHKKYVFPSPGHTHAQVNKSKYFSFSHSNAQVASTTNTGVEPLTNSPKLSSATSSSAHAQTRNSKRIHLLDDQSLVLNQAHYTADDAKTIHRSLLDEFHGHLVRKTTATSASATLSALQQTPEPSSAPSTGVLSRRRSADDTHQVSPIQTYVVLHQASHGHHFLHEPLSPHHSNSDGNNGADAHADKLHAYNYNNYADLDHTDVEHSRLSIASQLFSRHPPKKKHKRRGRRRDNTVRKIERLNFDYMETEIAHKQWRYDTVGRRGLYKWLICLCIGILTGVCMYVITIAIQFIIGVVILQRTRALVIDSWWKGTAYFGGCNLACALIAVSSVLYVERRAAGSGIPEVKAYLNGSWIPHLFNVRTLFVKLFGVTFAVAGSLVVGKEGPMVHTGAIIANGVSRGRSRTLGFDCNIGYTFRNDRDARAFISCGTAAGVAAAFGAPIGGMLFALEEVSSFWQSSLTWRAFFTAAVSAFLLNVLLSCFDNNSAGTCGEFTRIGLLTFSNTNQNQRSLSEYSGHQLIAFVLIGIFGGLIGAFFNFLNLKLNRFRKKVLYPRHPNLYPLLEVIFASLLTTMFIMVIPRFVYPHCRSNDAITSCTDNGDMTCTNITDENQFNCGDNEYNALSALMLGEREQIIKYVFHFDSQQFFEPLDLLIVCVAYFILAVYTYGLMIPSGLFIPLILIGSSFGWFCGYHWERLVLDNHNLVNTRLNTYALIGASALLGGSTRMTISLTAIIMEITNDIYYLLPIMMTVILSKFIGDRFNAAIYESHVALSGILYLEHNLPKWIPSFVCAKDVMTRNVLCLPVICPLRLINRYMRDENTLHNAFPIIDCEVKSEEIAKSWYRNYSKHDGKFVGIMLRWHIMILLSKRNFAPIQQLSQLPLLSVHDLTDSEYKNKYIASYQKDFGISLNQLNTCYVDFSPYMHLSPFTVQIYAPIHRVYTLFRGLGLRHLVVLDLQSKFVAGIITAANLSEPALEHCVNTMRRKMQAPSVNHQCTEDAFINDRLQHMNQSGVCKKYQVLKRFETTDNDGVDVQVEPRNQMSAEPNEQKIVSKFAIASNDSDMIDYSTCHAAI